MRREKSCQRSSVKFLWSRRCRNIERSMLRWLRTENSGRKRRSGNWKLFSNDFCKLMRLGAIILFAFLGGNIGQAQEAQQSPTPDEAHEKPATYTQAHVDQP